MKVYDIGDSRFIEERENHPLLGNIDIEGDVVGELIEINGILYTVHREAPKVSAIWVRRIEVDFEPKDRDFERHITCPYCGLEDHGSWEAYDDGDAEICEQCGGTFSYQRIVTAEYSSQPVEPPFVTRATRVEGATLEKEGADGVD